MRRALVARVCDISEYFLTTDTCVFLFSRRYGRGGKERERKKHSRSARAVSMSIASVNHYSKTNTTTTRKKESGDEGISLSFSLLSVRRALFAFKYRHPPFDETRTVRFVKENGRRRGKTERNHRAPVITTSSSLLLLLILVVSFPSCLSYRRRKRERKRGSKFCCTIRTRSSPSSSEIDESRDHLNHDLLSSFSLGHPFEMRVFVLARKDAKNNERERERERRRSHSRSLEANSLSFWCAQKPRWKFFSFYLFFFCSFGVFKIIRK